jgi:Amt family ammonium transporter
MQMKKLFTYFALAAALAFGGNALAQDKPAPAAEAKPAATAPADAKPAAEAPKPAAPAAAAEAPKPKVNKGDTAWMLASTMLVLLMSSPAWPCSMAAWCVPRTCCRS